jgi:uncharacterized protein (PEP-CTERM system associated)
MATALDMGMGMKKTNSGSDHAWAVVLVVGSAWVGTAARAQEVGIAAGPKQLLTVTPRVSVTETLTDNVRLSSTGAQSEQITEVSPGIRVNLQGARVKAYLDYALNQIVYAQATAPARSQNALSSSGTVEAIDNFAFVDFSASISQQSVSAFGLQSVDNTSINPNRAEVSSYRLSPRIQGRLGSYANYEAQVSRSVTSSNSAVASGVSATDGSGTVSGASGFNDLGWTADASRQIVDYSNGRPTESERANVGLNYGITPQLTVNARVGRETNNYTSLTKEGFATSGWGFGWRPSEATRLSGSVDQRSFGTAHNLCFEHRTPRTAWSFTDSKDVSTTPIQSGQAVVGSLYDYFFNLFATLQPDPMLRAQLVNTYLQINKLAPNTIIPLGFLTSAVSLQRRQALSFVLLGVRSTVTFIASQSESNRLDTVSTGVDDFNTSNVVRQQGLSANLAHRLTPDYSLGVLLSQQNTSGSSNAQESRLRLLSFNVTGRVGKKSSATVGVRRVESEGGVAPYVENAVTGSLNVQF